MRSNAWVNKWADEVVECSVFTYCVHSYTCLRQEQRVTLVSSYAHQFFKSLRCDGPTNLLFRVSPVPGPEKSLEVLRSSGRGQGLNRVMPTRRQF